MKSVLKILPAAGLALGLAVGAVPAAAQQPAQPQKTAVPDPSPAAQAAAAEILQLKNASAMYAGAVGGTVQNAKEALIAQHLNLQKDLNEVAADVAKQFAGREKEIGVGMAKVYASEFTEQELKDLVTFYKSPLGQKLITAEPQAIGLSMQFMQAWAQHFRDDVVNAFRVEMQKRGKTI